MESLNASSASNGFDVSAFLHQNPKDRFDFKFSCIFDIKEPLNELRARARIWLLPSGQRNRVQKRKVFDSGITDFCKLITKGPNELIFNYVFDLIRQFGKIPERCPLLPVRNVLE